MMGYTGEEMGLFGKQPTEEGVGQSWTIRLTWEMPGGKAPSTKSPWLLVPLPILTETEMPPVTLTDRAE